MYIYVNAGRCNCWMFPPNSTLKCLKQNSAFPQRRLKRTYGPVWASSLPVTKQLKANNKSKNLSPRAIHRKWHNSAACQNLSLNTLCIFWHLIFLKVLCRCGRWYGWKGGWRRILRNDWGVYLIIVLEQTLIMGIGSFNPRRGITEIITENINFRLQQPCQNSTGRAGEWNRKIQMSFSEVEKCFL